MNPIQKALLITLKPMAEIINTKIATKSGRIGNLGKFFKFGPREYGVHPSTKLLKAANYAYLFNFARHLG